MESIITRVWIFNYKVNIFLVQKVEAFIGWRALTLEWTLHLGYFGQGYQRATREKKCEIPGEKKVSDTGRIEKWRQGKTWIKLLMNGFSSVLEICFCYTILDDVHILSRRLYLYGKSRALYLYISIPQVYRITLSLFRNVYAKWDHL